MVVKTIQLSDKAITAAFGELSVTEIRDSRYPLRLRINKARNQGSWHLVTYHCGKANWAKVAVWPLVSAKSMIANVGQLTLQAHQDGAAAMDNWQTCAGLLSWYRDRALNDRGLSLKRKANIKCAINKHLIPVFGLIELTQLTHSVIDELFIWPAQSQYKAGTIRQHFAILKKAFKQAYVLKKIAVNPLGSLSFTDFYEHKILAKDARLFSKDLPQLLNDIERVNHDVAILIFLMLSYGLRIGETRLLKWQYIDVDSARLIVPAEITKTKTLLTLPLSKLVTDILVDYKHVQYRQGYRGAFLFPSPSNARRAITALQANEYVNQVSKGNWTAHDLRKLARSMWLDLSVDYIVGEQLVNHALSGLNQAYIHTHMDEQKRQAINVWHKHLESILNPFATKIITRSIYNNSEAKALTINA